MTTLNVFNVLTFVSTLSLHLAFTVHHWPLCVTSLIYVNDIPHADVMKTFITG